MEIQPVSRWFIYNNPQITGDYVLLGWVLGLATKNGLSNNKRFDQPNFGDVYITFNIL